MISSGTRTELRDSVSLFVSDERRLFLGLAVGAVGYFIWLSGTSVAVDRLVSATVGPVSVDPWSPAADLLATTYLVLWVLLPSVVAVRFVVGELTNIRGNIERRYRVDRPSVLLAPPLVALAVALVALLSRGVESATLVALGCAGVVLLVRTVAYGYRVYALSTPRGLQGLVFLAAAVTSLAVASRAAGLAGQDVLVRTAAAQYGVEGPAFDTVGVGAYRAPLLVLTGAVAPAVAALAYLCLQAAASLVVRVRQPDVPRSALRAGQRYPGAVRSETSPLLATSGELANDSADTSGETAADGADTSGETAGDGTDAPDVEAGESVDDRFGQTRVYTPPSDGDGGGDIPAEEREQCTVCDATYWSGDDPVHCPNCNAILDRE